MKKNIKNTIKQKDTLIKKSENKPEISVKKIEVMTKIKFLRIFIYQSH